MRPKKSQITLFTLTFLISFYIITHNYFNSTKSIQSPPEFISSDIEVNNEPDEPFTLAAFSPINCESSFKRNTSINKHVLFYNRVPKCGSTTMLSLIQRMKARHWGGKNEFNVENNIKPNQLHYIKEEADQCEFTNELTERVNHGSSNLIYIRHLHFVDFGKFGQASPLYINVIRDPVEHFISNYYFMRNGFEINNRKNLTDEEIERRKQWDHHELLTTQERRENLTECIRQQRGQCKSGYSDMIPYFCGNEDYCRQRKQKALQQAKENILKHFTVVGVLERFDETLKLFEELLPSYFRGVQESYKLRKELIVEKSKTADKKEESDEVKNYLRGKMAVEMELYEFVNKLMDENLKKIRQSSN